MLTKDIYTRLSVRVTDLNTKTKINSGSGFLHITKTHAFVFTAAHVIGDDEHEYEIECFFREDEVKEEDWGQYRCRVKGYEFQKHRNYLPGEDKKQFNAHDVAGIMLEKRPWMDHLPGIRFTPPTAGQVICFSGYPVKKWDESIEFAEKSCHTDIQITSHFQKRLQFLYPEHADWSSLGDVVEGFSGSGVYACLEACSVPCLVGILTCGQGANISLGSINAVSYLAVKELCDAYSWPSPLYTAEGATVDLPVLDRITANNENALTRQLSEEVRQKIDEMRNLIHNKKIEEALSLYDAFVQTVAYHTASESDRCYLLFIKARCHLLLQDMETTDVLLEEGMSYTVPERYWHLVEKANILMNRMGMPDEEVCLVQAEKLLEEAIGLDVKDIKAKIFKRYIEVVRSNIPLDEKLAYVHALSSDEYMDLKGMQDLYNVEATLYARDGQYEKAAEFYNTAYSFQGDEVFLIQSARMYLELADGKTSEPNLLMLAKASDLFVKYLENIDESLKKAFYRELGGAFLECAVTLGQYGLILKHIDGIIAETPNPDSVQKMHIMNVLARIEQEEPAYGTLKHMDSPDKKALYLHMQFQRTMEHYSQLLEDASVYSADAQAGIGPAQQAVEHCTQMLEELRQSLQSIAEKIQAFLSLQDNMLDQGIRFMLYNDRINCLLNSRSRDEYKEAIEHFQILFPELTQEHERNKLLLPEVYGEPEKTELLLLKHINRNRNLQRVQSIMNFYFRNLNYDGLVDFYESLISDTDGIGQFARESLIWAYLDFLAKPSSMLQKALQQFTKYKDELTDQNFRNILEMRLNHRCFCYHSHWMEDADLRVSKTHHESDYMDAIIIAVFNLEQEAAEYYYNDYVHHAFTSMSPDKQKQLCPGWMWPYFALTSPGEESGTARQMMNEKLESMLQTSRNRNPEEFQGWKLLRSMEEKRVIIDGPSLYYLSKHGLLQNVFQVVDKIIVTYSTIGICLENERYVQDPVIENIFQWIQAEDRVLLSEASLESQSVFREKFGSDFWFLKGSHCLAKEWNVPVVGACHNHYAMRDEMKTHIIWAGDFIGIVT